MNQINRIAKIIELLRVNRFSILEIKLNFLDDGIKISIRQLQREIKKINLFLDKQERLFSEKKQKTTFYQIIKYNSIENIDNKNYTRNEIVFDTKFYETNQNLNDIDLIKNRFENVIINKQIITIHSVKNDVTGDNYLFKENSFVFYPIKILKHRAEIYLGGWNVKRKEIEIFDIDQIKDFTIEDKIFKNQRYLQKFNEELKKRFGVTRNIDNEVYDIKIGFSYILSEFIINRHWHETQKFEKINNMYILHLKCGINRELIGWLLQWDYNVKIIEPEILKNYYNKALNEIKKNNSSNVPLVYRNIFVEKEK